MLYPNQKLSVSVFISLCIFGGYHLQHLVGLLFRYLWGSIFVEVVAVEWEYLVGLHSLRVAHAEHRGPGLYALQLVLQGVSPEIASNDAPYLPEPDVVEELAATDTYLAYALLIEVAGG